MEYGRACHTKPITYFVSVEHRTGFVFLKCFLIFNRLASKRYKTRKRDTGKIKRKTKMKKKEMPLLRGNVISTQSQSNTSAENNTEVLQNSNSRDGTRRMTSYALSKCTFTMLLKRTMLHILYLGGLVCVPFYRHFV